MGGCGTIRLWDPMISWRESISGITRLTKTGAVSQVQFMGRNSHAKKWILINRFFLSSSCFSSFFLTLPSLNSLLYLFTYFYYFTSHMLFVFVLSSTEAVGVRVLPSRSEGFLPAGHRPEPKAASCRSKVTNNQSSQSMCCQYKRGD